ncbi:53969d5a-8a0d-4b98-906d-497149c42c35 [Thermothielavioides terrestris]|uniref:53969d5a-8a0d-4b98-906d-497149c42c35 n=1 Tax=Thermothielavioides terrestris TaxID=2587410 RepID=A0A3S4F0B0_9PEZI|nr:53969d5a-8a0d-4b98-906d-497149c42c35 [Thermothielavioides terrestris]
MDAMDAVLRNFKMIPCPAGDSCTKPNCQWRHSWDTNPPATQPGDCASAFVGETACFTAAVEAEAARTYGWNCVSRTSSQASEASIKLGRIIHAIRQVERKCHA